MLRAGLKFKTINKDFPDLFSLWKILEILPNEVKVQRIDSTYTGSRIGKVLLFGRGSLSKCLRTGKGITSNYQIINDPFEKHKQRMINAT
jgi:hypothetical protein